MLRMVICSLVVARTALAAQATPRIDYRLAVDSVSATSFSVEMRVHGGPDTLHLAMAAHPEYDDRFWRYIRDVRAESDGQPIAVARDDSARWRVVVPGGDAVIRYRVEPPVVESRGSWVTYLSSAGGQVGDLHSFMYLEGYERVPARVTLRLPRGWTSATGLAPLSDSTYAAPTIAELLDSPIMIGPMRRWRFDVAGVPHEIAFASSGSHAPFDTAAFVGGIMRLARESHDVFGAFPYRRFVFQVHEDAQAGLEHGNSVSLGASSEDLARDAADFYDDAAHEYFHSWNEVALRPSGWGGVTTQPSGPTREMWWMEGVTMYYSELLRRRAMLPLPYATRRAQLEHDIGQYLERPANALVSPEDSGWQTGDPSETRALFPDVFLQGKLVGAMLDLVIRDSAHNRMSLDDVMKTLYRERAHRGYTGADLQHAAERTCSCHLSQFFDGNVRRANRLDFARYLASAGLRMIDSLVTATDESGRALPDLRVWARVPDGETEPRLLMLQSDGAWAVAGLQSGDRVVRWNGSTVSGMGDFRTRLRALNVGDAVALDYRRDGAMAHATVRVTPYRVHRVKLLPLPDATAQQLAVQRAAMLD
jgi:predicted metalloprotease with PDZ domain